MTRSEQSDASLEIEARRTQRASVLLVGAAHVASTGLRTVVRESASLRLVAELSAGPNAVSAAKQWQPEHILVAADGMTDEIISVMQQLRRTSPGSTMVVCTDRFRADVLLAAGQIPVEAILAWGDMTSAVLHETLSLVRQGIHVWSAPAAKEVLATAEDSSEALKARVGLTQREESVLQALGRAKTQRDAARDLGIAERTLQQRVIAIKDKLRIDQPFLLGAWAHALGVVTLEEPRE